MPGKDSRPGAEAGETVATEDGRGASQTWHFIVADAGLVRLQSGQSQLPAGFDGCVIPAAAQLKPPDVAGADGADGADGAGGAGAA